jgi:hypothetical protein
VEKSNIHIKKENQMSTPKTPEDLIMNTLVSSGLDREDETTQQLAGTLANLYEYGMSAVEMQSRISEIELSLTQKNKQISSITGKIVDDMQGRNLIDPKILEIRLKNLKRMQKEHK